MNACNPTRIVIERQKIYPGPRQKANPQNILDLAMMTGIIIGHFKVRVEIVFPHQWKFQIKDDVLYGTEVYEGRILERLTTTEKARICWPRARKTLGHNVQDAVGIGLHAVNRGF